MEQYVNRLLPLQCFAELVGYFSDFSFYKGIKVSTSPIFDVVIWLLLQKSHVSRSILISTELVIFWEC